MRESSPDVVQAKAAVRKARIAMITGHRQLLEHPSTKSLSTILLSGKNEVVSKMHLPKGYPATAWTDGTNKYYVAEFVNSQSTQQKVNGLIVHENGHPLLKHHVRGAGLDPKLRNIAMDLVLNDMIHHMDRSVVALPDGALYDPMFHNWTFMQVYRFLLQEGEGKNPQPGKGHPQPGKGQPAPSNTSLRGDPIDQHDFSEGIDEMSDEERTAKEEEIDNKIAEANVMAGMSGSTVPSTIQQAVVSRRNWLSVVREWMTSVLSGKDEYTYRRFNKRALSYGVFLPGTETERLGCGVISFDTSGSTLGPEMEKFAGEAQKLLDNYPPEELLALWWDTQVRSEQRFTPNMYANFVKLLKPVGGGGTHVGCVGAYMFKKNLRPDFHIIMTDGYTEQPIQWQADMTVPTLWIVTQNAHFKAPFGQIVFTDQV